jgi:hypothetical protein
MAELTPRKPSGSPSKDDNAETSQALFCAMADYAGITNIDKWFNPIEVKDKKNVMNTFTGFKSKWNAEFGKKGASVKDIFENKVKSGKSTYKQIDDFLTEKNEWYISSVLIANALIKDTTNLGKMHSKITGIGWKSIFYDHKNITMDNIEILFNRANEKQKKNTDSNVKKSFIPFGDINKWCPADIYFSSQKADTKIAKSATGKSLDNMTFISLNSLLGDLIDSGDLLPLSLKKQTSSVTIKKVNFDRTKDWMEIEKLGGGDVVWKPYPTSLSKIPANPPARDLKVFLRNTNNEQDKILFRHDASTAGFKGEIILKGMEARGGSLGFEQILAIIGLVDETMPNKIKTAYDSGNTTFKSKKKPIRKEYEDAVKYAGIDIKSSNPKDKKRIGEIRKSIQYDEKVGQLSGVYVTNKVMKIISDFLSDEDVKSNFVRMVYAYAASQSFDSAKFIIAK